MSLDNPQSFTTESIEKGREIVPIGLEPGTQVFRLMTEELSEELQSTSLEEGGIKNVGRNNEGTWEITVSFDSGDEETVSFDVSAKEFLFEDVLNSAIYPTRITYSSPEERLSDKGKLHVVGMQFTLSGMQFQQSDDENINNFNKRATEVLSMSDNLRYLVHAADSLVRKHLQKIDAPSQEARFSLYQLQELLDDASDEDQKVLGSYYPEKDFISLRPELLDEEKNPGHALLVLIHELIHYYGFVHNRIHSSKKGDTYFRSHNRRAGFLNTDDLEEGHEHFRGLNEAVVETIALRILNKHRDQVLNSLPITEEEFEELREKHYKAQRVVFTRLVESLSEVTEQSDVEVFEEFEQAHFTGKLFFLRKIDDVFGPGSLRLLAAFSSDIKRRKETQQEQSDRQAQHLKEYFNLDASEEERLAIAKEVLSRREYARFKKFRNHFEYEKSVENGASN